MNLIRPRNETPDEHLTPTKRRKEQVANWHDKPDRRPGVDTTRIDRMVVNVASMRDSMNKHLAITRNPVGQRIRHENGHDCHPTLFGEQEKLHAHGPAELCLCDGQSHIAPEFFTSFCSKLFIISLRLPQFKPAGSHITSLMLGVLHYSDPWTVFVPAARPDCSHRYRAGEAAWTTQVVSLGATKQFFISRFDSNALRPSAPFMVFRGFGLSDEDFANHRLALRNERPLIAGQRSKQGQFQPLHRGLDAP